MKKKIKSTILGLSSIFMLMSCSENAVSNNTCQSNLTLVCNSQDDRKKLSVGETNQIEAHVYGGLKDEVNYQSLNEDIVSVNETGLVTALKKGSGRIKVTSKADDSISKVISFTVVENLSQAFSCIAKAKEDLSSYEYKKGVTIPLNIKMDIGKVSGRLTSTSIKMELFDTSNTSKYGNLSLPINLSIYDYGETESQMMVQTSIQSKTFINDILSRNLLISAADKISNIKGMLYSSLFSFMDESFNTYLDENDYKEITSINLSTINSEPYISLSREFVESTGKSTHPFAFRNINLVSFLLPLYKKYKSIINSEDKENETSLDLSSMMTKDGLLQISSFLSNYIEEKIEGDTSTLSLDKTMMKMVQSLYSEYVKSSYIEYGNDKLELSFTLPETITGVNLVRKTSEDTHPTKAITLNLLGSRVGTGEEYTFLSVVMDKPSQCEDDTVRNLYTETKGYVSSLNAFTYDSTSTTVEKMIKESDILYQAEKNYGATNNQNMKDKKDSLLSYYYSSFISEEKRRLLYPLYRRIASLDLSYQDSVVTRLDKDNISDDETAHVEVVHLLNGDKTEDFNYSITSQDEEIVKTDEDGNILPVKAIYNGQVNDENEKETDSTTTLDVSITPKDNIETISSQTKTLTIKYVGNNKGFRQTKTTFKSADGFDEESREYQVKSGSTFDPSTIVNLPSGAIATYSTTDDTLAKKSGLLSNKFTILDPTGKKNLVGIRITVVYTETTLKTETVVFYLRIS